MKFFTVEDYRAWYDYGVGDGLAEWERYNRHLHSMRGVLSTEVLSLARPFGVEDGLIVRVRHDREHRLLDLTMRCGDLVMGYYDLNITYRQAEISSEHERVLAHIARTTRSHLRYESDLYRHEVDVTEDGGVAHRLMFHPGVWFEIRCKELHVKRTPKQSRRLPSFRDRYSDVP